MTSTTPPPSPSDPSTVDAPAATHLQFCATATNDEIVDEMGELSARVCAATCRLVLLAAEIDKRGIWGAQFARSAAHWLSWRLGIDASTGREYVRVGHAVQRLPEVLLSFSRGETSYSKVRAITRVAKPGDGIDWVVLAATMSAGQLERFTRAVKVAESDPGPSWESRHSVSIRYDHDGTVLISARLSAADGALVVNALEALADDRPADPEPVEDVSAEAWSTTPAPPDSRPRRVQALVDMARAAQESAPGGGSAVPRPLVVLHVDADRAWIPDGSGLDGRTADRLACDAVISAVVHGRDGRSVDVGRKQRLVTPRLRRVIEERDDHRCQAPGCDATRFLDAHHVIHWSHGGRTDADNLILMCDTHHRALHEGAFGIAARGNGRFTFHSPTGALIPRTHRSRVSEEAQHSPLSTSWMPDVTPDSLLPHYDTGERRWFSDAVSTVAVIRQRALAQAA